MPIEKHWVCTIVDTSSVQASQEQVEHAWGTVLEREIRASIFQGYTVFQCSAAMGPEILAGEIVMRLRNEFPGIRLRCYQPCETQANEWPEEWSERYFLLMAQANNVHVLQGRHTKGCEERAVKLMIEQSGKVILAEDTGGKGLPRSLVAYAGACGAKVVALHVTTGKEPENAKKHPSSKP